MDTFEVEASAGAAFGCADHPPSQIPADITPLSVESKPHGLGVTCMFLKDLRAGFFCSDEVFAEQGQLRPRICRSILGRGCRNILMIPL